MRFDSDTHKLDRSARDRVDELVREWARVVSHELDGSEEMQEAYARSVFDRLLALRDALRG